MLEKEDYVDVHHTLQEENRFTEDTFDDYEREEALLRKRVVASKLRPLRLKIRKLAFVDPLKTFRKLFQPSFQVKENISLPSHWEEICRLTDNHLKKKFLTWEDAPAYIYFEKKSARFQRTTYDPALVY